MIGPENPFSQELHASKYRGDDESFDDYAVRYARSTSDDTHHFRGLLDGLRSQRILPAGRQQLAVGRPYQITAMNCYVGGVIDDSMEGIMEECKRSALTLRTGGGCGWDFSTIRPHGDPIRGLGIKAYSTGPVTFMQIWDAMCGTVMSAGHRRGAMMGVLRVDHPDIMKFINAKQDQRTLANFNISLGVTDEFMEAVKSDGLYSLTFNGREYDKVRALDVWARIMERNWDWAEPGVLFIDRINQMNNLWYCETISATNPCGEQPLPPHGACLLGSLNIVKYITPTMRPRNGNILERVYEIDFDALRQDVEWSVRAYDNVIDRTHYPLPEQQREQQNKRRMGVGVTGMANALEICGASYGTKEYLELHDKVMITIRDHAYRTSVKMAKEKGAFPLFDAEKYCQGKFIKTLPEDIQEDIKKYGIRNSHLLSIAPTGTISLAADNVSSGIEPPYSLKSSRLVHMPEGQREIEVNDYAFAKFGVKGRTAYDVTPQDHIRVLCATQKYVDSAVSKTCNVNGQISGEGPGVTFEEFKQLYMSAYEGGAKGCTTFNVNGKRFGIMKAKPEESDTEIKEGAACTIDPTTGIRTCEG